MEVPGFRERLSWLSAVAGMDLVAHGTTSDADTIKDTAVAQPLIVGSGLVSLLALFEHPMDGFRLVGAGAGHSVGEITAASAAGVLSAEQAMVFVRERGAGMAAASAASKTGMSAVLGGDRDEVLTVIAQHGLTAANINAAGQVVAAGTMEQLAALKNSPPAKTRVIPLPVAGAFHTEHMAPAVGRLAGLAAAISTHDSRIPLVSNRDGQVMHQGREVLSRLVSQVRRPVRWDLTMESLASMGVTGLIEIPPAGTLVGLAKRGMPGVETLALKSPDDLEQAIRMVGEHGEQHDSGIAPSWRLVIAPAKGIVNLDPTEIGTTIVPGSQIAEVSTLRDSYPVVSPHGGQIIEWLVADGDPVAPGQPLVRLHPTSTSR